MKANCPNAPRVFITPEAKRRLDLYLALCPDEISGLGEVERIGRDFLVTSLQLFSQEVTAGSTELDGDAVQTFLFELVKAGDDPAKFKLWWHSHVGGSTFWSGTDDATCERFGNGWMLSVVGNNRGEYRARLDLYEPVRVTLDELALEVYQPVDLTLRDAIRDEIRVKVRKPKPPEPVVQPPTPRFFRPGLGDEASREEWRARYWPQARPAGFLNLGGE